MATPHDLATLISAMQGVLYALLIALVLRRRGAHEQDAGWLILYTGLACLWAWALAAAARPGLLPDQVATRLPTLGVCLLAWPLLHLTRSFLRMKGAAWGWPALAGVWLAAWLLVEANPVGLPETVGMLNGWAIRRPALAFGVLVAGWAVFLGGAALLTLRGYRRAQQPLHRNRITYWMLAWVLLAVGEALFLGGQRLPGGGLRLAGVLVATYAIVTHCLPDVRQTVRRVVSYLLITLLTVGLYTAGFVAMQVVFQAVPGYSPLMAGTAMALILAVLFQPLLGVVQRVVNRVISGASYDANHMLGEYSMNISNILDLELLANVMLRLIGDGMRVRRGRIFLVDYVAPGPAGHGPAASNGRPATSREERDSVYCLREVGSGAGKAAVEGRLSAGSPIAEYLRHEQRPLTQYDVDLLVRFKTIPPEERAWLAGLGMDVYVSIHAKGEWIGLLTLGPKLSGDRYFDQDLALLRTLADQTAVALENARLVADLVNAHDDLGQTCAALARANHQLQELDKLKSAFIGVITHELRTPFANMVFALELLERHGRGHLPAELGEQLDQLASGIQAARTMVDNLVTFATFLSKQGELQTATLNMSQVIQESVMPLRSLAQSKRITVYAMLPDQLPPVSGDRERLGEAVHHLVHNALKFTGPGGEVWINCQAVDHSVRLEVKDTGVGVPADKLPGLWEGFAQMADPLRRGVEGLGLGLALVKYVVNAHGGEVWAESQEGAGSTFGFRIPTSSAAADRTADPRGHNICV
jgi:signal transduction histidine kinase